MIDIEEQYEKIYRYCYYRLRDPQRAEDVTQETFLRYFASDSYRNTGQVLHYLYTIARHLCVDEFRRPVSEPLPEALPSGEDLLTHLAVQAALEQLAEDDRELVLLRYGNEVPMGVLCRLYGVSRFALYRRLQRILKQLKTALKEDDP